MPSGDSERETLRQARVTEEPHQVVTRTLEERRDRFLRRWAEQGPSVAAGMVRTCGTRFFLSWATWATKVVATDSTKAA